MRIFSVAVSQKLLFLQNQAAYEQYVSSPDNLSPVDGYCKNHGGRLFKLSRVALNTTFTKNRLFYFMALKNTVASELLLCSALLLFLLSTIGLLCCKNKPDQPERMTNLEFKCKIVDREKRKAAFSRHWGEQQHGNKRIQITSFSDSFFFSSGILFTSFESRLFF